MVLISYTVRSLIFLRLGSEYEHRFGSRYVLAMLAVAQITHLLGMLLLSSLSWQSVFSNSSCLSLYVLSLTDPVKFKATQVSSFEKE